MRNNPRIFEINARVWIRRFDNKEQRAGLKDVPIEYWENLKALGFDAVWLMGVWQTVQSTIEKYCFEEGLIREYNRALDDWNKKDVIGSPFAINSYSFSDEFGNPSDLLELKEILNNLGIKLILDFIPNHFNAETTYLKTNPEIFLSAPEQFYKEDSHTFFKALENEERFFAHGRDPFFSAWQDTIQINYFNDATREFMINQLVNITKYCDGVRCDMAMLALNNVFHNTWVGVLNSEGIKKPKEEFWKLAIDFIKNINKDFKFIAEAYWDLEYDLQQMGFDYTYDKRLTDRLKHNSAHEVRAHLGADLNYQSKSLRFIENHDEERAISAYGKHKSKAAAVVISTIMGMRFFNDGQFEGKKIKLPVQLGREPLEEVNNDLHKYYTHLLKITNNSVFFNGRWIQLKPKPISSNDQSFENMLSWIWSDENEKRLVVINYSNVKSRCRLQLEIKEYPLDFILNDLLNEITYIRSAKEIINYGLYIELNPYSAHIFKF